MNQKQTSGIGIGVGASLVGLAFVILPLLFSNVLSGASATMLVGFGVILFLTGCITITVTKLYVKAPANRSFIRTGAGGELVVTSGGAFVIPVIQSILWVGHETMRLEVGKKGSDSLITGDRLRVDLGAEFFIKVQKEESMIKAAASSLGDKSTNPVAIKELVDPKIVAALRAVTATKTLMELHKDRKEFAKSVKEALKEDLESNGLTLESVTISALDQTPLGQMSPDDNIFDAEGAKTISEIVNKQSVERNALEKQATRDMEDENVKTLKHLMNNEKEQKEAAANQFRDIQNVKALAEQESSTFATDQKKKIETAQVEAEQRIELVKIAKAKVTKTATVEQEKIVQEADIDREKVIATAKGDKEISITNKEEEKAVAKTKQLEAEVLEAEANQKVLTVETIRTAERSKQQKIIEEEGSIEKDQLRKNMEVNVQAYEVIRTAEADKQAAQNKATSIETVAKANKVAVVLSADGKKAEAMVPVDVSKAEVVVAADRVKVLEQELRAKSEHADITKELVTALAQIEANQSIGVAKATAMGIALSQTKMQLFGDPSTVAKLMESFHNGQNVGMVVEGLNDTLPKGVKDTVSGAASGMGNMASALIKKLTGTDISPEVVEGIINNVIKRKDG